MTKLTWRDDPEYLALVSDLLAKEPVQRLANYTQHHHSNRLDHSISVSYNSYLVAKKLGLNTRATARGGLLHDLFYYDWRTTKFNLGSHAFIHPRVALRNAEKLTDLSLWKRILSLNTCGERRWRCRSIEKARLYRWWMIMKLFTNSVDQPVSEWKLDGQGNA